MAGEPEYRLYSQWKARYPDDPLSYARLAILLFRGCDAKNGQAVLNEGLTHTNAAFLQYLQTSLPQIVSSCQTQSP